MEYLHSLTVVCGGIFFVEDAACQHTQHRVKATVPFQQTILGTAFHQMHVVHSHPIAVKQGYCVAVLDQGGIQVTTALVHLVYGSQLAGHHGLLQSHCLVAVVLAALGSHTRETHNA